MDLTTFLISDVLTLMVIACSGVGAWVAITNRLVKLEAQSSALEKRLDAENISIDRRFTEASEARKEQFDQIMSQLHHIDRKLDAKADKKTSGG